MAELTMLTEMMSRELPQAVAALAELDITLLDLKGGVFGHRIEELDGPAREQLAALLEQTGVEAYCFSSVLGHKDVSEVSEKDFRGGLAEGVANLLATARQVRPTFIRLLACTFGERREMADSNECLAARAAWVWPAYRDAIEQIAAAGMRVTIENEPDSVLASPAEVLGFFDRLDCSGKVGFTWDVQNMWQSGTYPTRAVYQALRPVTNYVHLKGGRAAAEQPEVMAWRSCLEDATWDVPGIVREVLADGVSAVLCLNVSHGQPGDDYPFPELLGDRAGMAAEEARRDVAFLRKTFPEVS